MQLNLRQLQPHDSVVCEQSPERQSGRMSEIKNGRLGLYGAEHSKCNQMMTLGFKGLILYRPRWPNRPKGAEVYFVRQ